MARSSGEEESTSSSSSSSEEEKVIVDSGGGGGGSGGGGSGGGGGGGFVDPDSPNSKTDSTSSSSEGVLVEHPVNTEQARGAAAASGHREAGILVNIDGSMQENLESDEGSREESFVDAPDSLGYAAEGRNISGGSGLEESLAMIENGEQGGEEKKLMAEVNRLRGLLSRAMDECGRYKAEQELLGREIGSVRCQLKAIVHRRPPIETMETLAQHDMAGDDDDDEEEEEEEESELTLHSLLHDCSELTSQLGATFDEHLQLEGTIGELHAALEAKDQENEDLNGKLSECLVHRDVVASYMDSLKESSNAVVRNLMAPLASVVQDYEVFQHASIDEGTLIEKKMLLLIDKYDWFRRETEQLGRCLDSISSKFAMPDGMEIGNVFDAACSELVESKTRETIYIEKINDIEKEKGEIFEKLDRTSESLREAQSEASKAKTQLEELKQRYVSTKEKLGIAVSKGKSLVQHRDSLKQLLAEKTAELDGCLQELQHKSDSLEAAVQSVVRMKQGQDLVISLQSMISEKDSILHAAEETMSQSDFPEELQSTGIIDRIKWLIDQRKISEGVLLVNNRLEHALAPIGLPANILSSSLEDQINWLGESFAGAKEDLSKTQEEMGNAQEALQSRQSELLQARNEIEYLKELLFVENQEKHSLHVVNEDVIQKFERIVENSSRLSLEKNELMRVLGELSECLVNDEMSEEVADFMGKCVQKIKEKMNVASKPSSDETEGLQKLQSLLYDRNLELAFCETMLVEEMTNLSEELHTASEKANSLRNERDSLQRDVELAEDKSSLIREKLSMAVKKGKGLVQEREGFKKSLEEKNSEIDMLKHELKLQESIVTECKQQIMTLTADLEQIKKLEADITRSRDERDQIELLLQERNSLLQKVIKSIEQIGPPSSQTFEGPVEMVKWIAQHLLDVEAGKTYAEKELERLKEEVALRANELSEASVNIRSLECALSEAKEHGSVIFKEKEATELCKSSIELELKKAKEVVGMQSGELEQTYNSVNSLEEALLNEKNRIYLLINEKNKLETKNNQEIMTLNAKIAACMEELEGTNGSLKNQSAQFRYLLSLTNDNNHLPLATERFRTSVTGLKNMVHFLESIYSHVSAGGLQSHPGSKQVNALTKLCSLPELEEYVNGKQHNTVEGMAEVDDSLSFTKVAECLTAQSKLLDDRLTHVSCYINDHVTLLMQVLQEIRDYIVHILELGESYKQNVNQLDASNKAQEVQISCLHNDLSILRSACSDAMQALQINSHEILDLGNSEQTYASLDACDVDAGGSSAKEHIRTAENLLNLANSTKNKLKQLSDAKNIWKDSIDDLKFKLQRAEMDAESAYQQKNVEHERVAKMEEELKTLQNFCSKLKSMVEDYQSMEVVWKDKEKELASLQKSLIELKSTVEDYQSQELIWKDKEKKLASLQDVCSTLKSMEEGYQSRENVWKEKEKELASLQSICSEMKSSIEYYQSREEVLKNQEKELNSLQSICSELKSTVADYQSREVAWKEKEEVLASLQQKLALRDAEGSEKLVLQNQLATLFEKVNTLKIPFVGLEVDGWEQQFSSDMDKMLYVLSSVETFQNMMGDLTTEKENLQSILAAHANEAKQLKKVAENLISDNQELKNRNNDLNELTTKLERILQEFGSTDLLEDNKLDLKGLLSALERLIMTSCQESESSKLRARELGAKLFTTEKVVDELSSKVKSLEDLARSVSPETKDRGIIESSSSITTSEISEVEVAGAHGKSSLSGAPAAALRPMRKGSNDHLILNIDTESDRLIGSNSNESKGKGHVFKSLNTSGLIPKQGKMIADKVDGVWVSGGRILMGRPGARMGLIAYWALLHIWVLATIL